MTFLKYSKMLLKIFVFAIRINITVGRTVKVEVAKYRGA
jgi:hypothetical protein